MHRSAVCTHSWHRSSSWRDEPLVVISLFPSYLLFSLSQLLLSTYCTVVPFLLSFPLLICFAGVSRETRAPPTPSPALLLLVVLLLLFGGFLWHIILLLVLPSVPLGEYGLEYTRRSRT